MEIIGINDRFIKSAFNRSEPEEEGFLASVSVVGVGAADMVVVFFGFPFPFPGLVLTMVVPTVVGYEDNLGVIPLFLLFRLLELSMI